MKRCARPASQSGSATVEALGLVGLVLLASLGTLQVGIIGTAEVATQHAVSVGARAAASGQGDPARTAVGALPTWLRADARASLSGGRVTIVVDVPRVFPGLSADALRVSGSITVPEGAHR